MRINNLKELRASRGLTQRQFAKMIKKTPSFVYTVESGKSGVSKETANDICNALEVSIDELISNKEVCVSKDRITGLLRLNDFLSTVSPKSLKSMKTMSEIASQHKISNDEIKTIIEHLLGGIYD